MAVRYKGQVMTEVKFNEVVKAEKAQEAKKADQLNLMQKLNVYFFGEPEISKTDWLWYYGTFIFNILMLLLVLTSVY